MSLPLPSSTVTTHPATRREFLRIGARGLGFLAFAPYAPSFLAQAARAGVPAPERDRTILVLIQLAGGNDGLNTVIPFRDDAYYRLRPNLAIQAADRIEVHPDFALPSRAEPLAKLFHDGRLGIIRNVGYPNPNRSHFRSMEIWESGSSSNQTLATGWIGRYLDHACAGHPTDSPGPEAIAAADEMPPTFMGEHAHTLFNLPRRRRRTAGAPLLEQVVQAVEEPTESPTGYLRHTLMDTLVTERRVGQILQRNRPEASYPRSRLGRSLEQIAGLIAGGMETRIYFASLGGFDTHVNQRGTHARLIGDLSGSLAAFQADLEARGLASQVLTMTFSEFGRRASENGGAGTDHGTSAPLFLMGSSIQVPVFGNAPVLPSRGNQDLTFETDFRQVYATVLERWLGGPTQPVLGRNWDSLPIIG